jgi:tRNA pseudouridine13 synthase
LFVPKVERLIGIEAYATRSLGIGGVIKQSDDDFIVEEMLVDGSKAEVDRFVERQVLGSSAVRNQYLICVLVKRNWDMFTAVRNVAGQLGIATGQIHIGGIKDAKAITAQYVTIEGVSKEDAQKIKIKDIDIRPIGYLHRKLSSYYLLGNNFHITVNKIPHSKLVIQKRMTETIEALKTIGGAPNFFGYQRFGTTRTITHLVGKALIQAHFKKAAMLFLAKPFPHEHPDSRQARQKLKLQQDFGQAFKDFPKQLRYERLMLRHLAKRPDDFVGSFRMLPTKLRELFPQAYQSYLFNKSLSRRIGKGLRLDRAEVGDYAVNVERSGLPIVTMFKVVTAGNLAEINEAIVRGKMRLALPMVGFAQQPSQGLQGEIDKQILEEEAVSPEDFKINTMPEISGRGELRAALTPVNNFKLDKIQPDSADPSKYKVKVSFALSRGSYATIVMRELMKPRNPIKAKF